ncbi:MAG: alpha-glucosidase [Bacteroidota bacterium]
MRNWWKETFVYQIYPRSFKDSNGDGIGDLKGITQSLDYLQNLGVETLWLSPIYKSPNDDNGYDVADYTDIMDEFGTMKDFDEMLAGIKARGMRVILDLVVNHSSDEHRWFESAKASKDSPYRDYYIFREGKDGQPPNNWLSIFGGSAWEYNEATDDYYLHLFTRKQPDLNWENPALREEVYKLMRFWLDKGIDGYRMDVIPFISKRPGLPDVPFKEGEAQMISLTNWYANGPRLHEFLQEMNREVMAHYDCMTVGEGIGVWPDNGALYVDPDRKELDMIYYFDHMFLDRDFENGGLKPMHWPAFKKIIHDWDSAVPEGKGWNTFYFGNHDQPRSASRFGNTEQYHYASATMLATMLFTLRLTPYLYQGEEIGMTNITFNSPEEFADVDMINQYKAYKVNGGRDEDFLPHANTVSRDHARTPFLWDDSHEAGFTTGTPWLMVNPNYPQINAAAALANPGSIFHYYKDIIAFRKAHDVLVYGSYKDLALDHAQIFYYERELGEMKLRVLLNLTEEAVDFAGPGEGWKKVKGNYEGESGQLRPYEACIFQLS